LDLLIFARLTTVLATATATNEQVMNFASQTEKSTTKSPIPDFLWAETNIYELYLDL